MASDFGLKISKPGYDVFTAGDSDLIFSSAWPSLPVAFRGYSSDGIINHGLGFPPFTVFYYQNDDDSWSKDIAPVDKDNVYATGYVVCYNIDLSKNREYPTFAPPQVQSGDSDDYGVKLSKEGESIESHDMRNFILHSRCQTPLILTVMTEESPNASKTVEPPVIPGLPSTTVYTLVYNTALTYPSWVFGFIKIDGGSFGGLEFGEDGYYPAPYYQQAYPKTTTDGVTTTLMSVNDGGTILALRDPFFANETEQVNY